MASVMTKKALCVHEHSYNVSDISLRLILLVIFVEWQRRGREREEERKIE